MASDKERIARLESRDDQKGADIERLYAKLRSQESLQADVAKLLAWRAKITGRVRQCTRAAFWCAALLAAKSASGSWVKFFGKLAEKLAGGLG